jgi:hypothetical protein
MVSNTSTRTSKGRRLPDEGTADAISHLKPGTPEASTPQGSPDAAVLYTPVITQQWCNRSSIARRLSFFAARAVQSYTRLMHHVTMCYINGRARTSASTVRAAPSPPVVPCMAICMQRLGKPENCNQAKTFTLQKGHTQHNRWSLGLSWKCDFDLPALSNTQRATSSATCGTR